MHSFNDGSQQQQLIDSIQNNEIYDDANMDFANVLNYSSDGPATRRFDFGSDPLTNFNSNDTNILHKKLLEMQSELEMLEAEHQTLIQEKDQMVSQNNRIKI